MPPGLLELKGGYHIELELLEIDLPVAATAAEHDYGCAAAAAACTHGTAATTCGNGRGSTTAARRDGAGHARRRGDGEVNAG